MVHDLQKIQDLFWQLTQAPEGVEKKFSELKKAGKVPIADLNQLISERSPGQALDRMEIYAQMYFWRLFESLEEDFSVTAALLGRENFHALVVAYLNHYPSQNYDLAMLGENLPRFLSECPLPLQDSPELLRELSTLEWQVIEVSREEEALPLTEDNLREVPVEQWEDLELQRIPASRVIFSSFNLIHPWQKKITEGKRPSREDFHPLDQGLLLWRRNGDLQLQDLEPQEIQLLHRLQEPLTFSKLCEACYEFEPTSAAQLASQYLKRWVDWEILCLAA